VADAEIWKGEQERVWRGKLPLGQSCEESVDSPSIDGYGDSKAAGRGILGMDIKKISKGGH
jgi:hypothetical protein